MKPPEKRSDKELQRSLMPIFRELRAFAPQGHVKSIVKSFAAEGAIVLSEPSDAPVTPEELLMEAAERRRGRLGCMTGGVLQAFRQGKVKRGRQRNLHRQKNRSRRCAWTR